MLGQEVSCLEATRSLVGTPGQVPSEAPASEPGEGESPLPLLGLRLVCISLHPFFPSINWPLVVWGKLQDPGN